MSKLLQYKIANAFSLQRMTVAILDQPLGPRKSGMPADVLIPAPVITVIGAFPLINADKVSV